MSTHLPHIIGSREYMHATGELSKVEVTPTGLGYGEVRIAGLPPEVTDTIVCSTLAKYGEMREIHGQTWSNKYRYKV
jgi:hypothetical protein